MEDLIEHYTVNFPSISITSSPQNQESRIYKLLHSYPAAWDEMMFPKTKWENIKHGKMKELKYFLTTGVSTNILCDFLRKPVFWATEEGTEYIRCSKVTWLWNGIPKILKESQVFKTTLLRRSGCLGNRVLDLLIIILRVLFGFNFILHKLHQSFIYVRSLLRVSRSRVTNLPIFYTYILNMNVSPSKSNFKVIGENEFMTVLDVEQFVYLYCLLHNFVWCGP